MPFFFFNDTATTEIYTLSLHDALPIFSRDGRRDGGGRSSAGRVAAPAHDLDRKSTRLNSSHSQISYAVFCLEKKKTAASRMSYEPLVLQPPVDPVDPRPGVAHRHVGVL